MVRVRRAQLAAAAGIELWRRQRVRPGPLAASDGTRGHLAAILHHEGLSPLRPPLDSPKRAEPCQSCDRVPL